jgi:Anti-sigma-K factor rskA
MDEPKTPLPTLLPWAATACLAALVACIGELWIIEKARMRLIQDQSLLAGAALKATENQLEAERILNRREREQYATARAAGADFKVVLLSAPNAVSPEMPASGAIVVDPAVNVCLVRVSFKPGEDPDRDFQLWLLGPGPGHPRDCGTFHSFSEGDSCVQLKLPQPFADGCYFILTYGIKGGARTLEEATSRGMIELASRPQPGKITN